MEFLVEKNIPFPEKETKAKKIRDTLIKMEVGESFSYPVEIQQSMSIQITNLKSTMKFVTRKIDEKNRRVWKVAK